MGQSSQLFDTNWKNLSIDISFCLKVFTEAKFYRGKVDVVVDLLWMSEFSFIFGLLTFPEDQVPSKSFREEWGVGGQGARAGYMAEFPRILAKDEKDKEILFF